MQSVDHSTGTGRNHRMYVFLQTETESWILTDRPEQGGESMTAGQTMDRNVTDSNAIYSIEGDGSGTDAELWSILPDSLEYRETIWRDLI